MFKLLIRATVLVALFSCSSTKNIEYNSINIEAITLHIEEVVRAERVGHPKFVIQAVGSNNVPYSIFSRDSLINKWILTSVRPTRLSFFRRDPIQTRISSLTVESWEPIRDQMIIKFRSTEGLECYLETSSSDTLIYTIGLQLPFLTE